MLGGCKRVLVLRPLLFLSMMSNGVALPSLILNLHIQFLNVSDEVGVYYYQKKYIYIGYKFPINHINL